MRPFPIRSDIDIIALRPNLDFHPQVLAKFRRVEPKDPYSEFDSNLVSTIPAYRDCVTHIILQARVLV